MRYLSTVIFSIFIGFLLSSCGEGKKPSAENTNTVKQVTAATPPPNIDLPALPDDKKKILLDKVDYVDYIFYNMDFSMSQSDMMAIKTNLSYISKDPISKESKNCPKSMGRKFFHANGEIIMEAEIILSPNCNHYVFMDGNTPLYASQMRQKGIDFYNNLIKQVTGGQNQ